MKVKLIVAGLFVALIFATVYFNHRDIASPRLITDSTHLSAIRPNVGSIDSFTITSNTNWTVAVIPAIATWLTVSPATGAGTAKIYIRVAQSNVSSSTQTASVVVISSDKFVSPITIPVTQKQFNPHLVWSTLVGGTGPDEIIHVMRTSVGGGIGWGITSNNNQGGFDMVIVKLNNRGKKTWIKSFSGSSSKSLNSIALTNDGGYIMASGTTSIDGDMEGIRRNDDLVVVKLDSNGIRTWVKKVSGLSVDDASSVITTKDGGYAIVGYTQSRDEKLTPNQRNVDMFVLKLDSNGTKQWATNVDHSLYDYANSIAKTTDGGYVVAGTTRRNTGDVDGSYGSSDILVVKLDSNGTTIWTKAFGGSSSDYARSIIAAADGGCVIAGETGSIDGDITDNHGGSDIWVVKLNNNGGKCWAKTLGGTADDGSNALVATDNGCYVIAGYTTSNDGDAAGSRGLADAFIVKLDGEGRKLWTKTFGGSLNDYATAIITTTDGRYIVGGYTLSSDGDIHNNRGDSDGWFIKIEDE